MKKIQVAVIGSGGISKAHNKGLLAFPDLCEIVALCDIYPEKAEKLKQEYDLNCVIFDSHESILTAEIKPDLVHICTPPFTHAPIAISCMDKGIHVVVEKPMATCLEDCDRMLEAEKRNGVTLFCISQNRFRDPIYKLKKISESGLVGKVKFADVRSLWWRGHSYYDLWWRGLWEKEGGGPTLNHAVHHIDMLNWIKSELPEEVTAVLANVMHDNSEVEDLSIAILKYKDGTLAQILSSVVHHGEEQGIELQCEFAKISAPWSCLAFESKPNGFFDKNEELENKISKEYAEIPLLIHQGHTGQIDDILTSVQTGKLPLVSSQDGKMTMELITAIYKSGCKKQTVKLPLEKDDEFYHFEGILKNAIRFHKKSGNVENFGDDEISLGNY
jgi:predicted dehydrogenase